MKYPALRATALAVVLAAPGCFFSAETLPAPRVGTLTVDWTIAGTKDPAACGSFQVDSMDLVVSDDTGAVVREVTAPCDAFTVSVDLADGVYSADATLLDSGTVATANRPLDGLDVVGSTELVVDVDFPPGSFL